MTASGPALVKSSRALLLMAVAAMAVALASACGGDKSTLTIYVGRSQTLVQPLLERFSKDTGVRIRVRYGDGTDLALGILEEGKNSPADIYYGQDVGAMGALKAAGRLQPLSPELLDQVPEPFRAHDGTWVGVSGRARVLVYNTDKINPATLPKSVLDYTNPQWRNRLGIVPRSDGFPEFVTAMRLVNGEEATRQWLQQLKANNPRTYPNNIAALQAVANGEIDVALINHYYLYRFRAEQGDDFKARNFFFSDGDLGGLFLVSPAAVLDTAKDKEAAEKFIAYLLSPEAQKYFADETYEYPMVAGVAPAEGLPDLASLKTPNLDLSNLTDLQGSLKLLQETAILP